MNRLYYGDNLQILREHIRDESVDLIYLDPPFNSQGSYNVLFRGPTGKDSEAQMKHLKTLGTGTTVLKRLLMV
jgi:site-specific DNA-methyltransferase (adenine-specific)